MDKSFLRCIIRKEEYFSKIMSSYVLVMSAVRLHRPFGYKFLFSHHSLSAARLLFMLVCALLHYPFMPSCSCSFAHTSAVSIKTHSLVRSPKYSEYNI